MFGGTSSFGGFGQQQQNQQQQQSQQQQQPGGLFGNTASTFGSAFGQPQQANGAFGQPAAATPSFGGGFGAGNTTTPAFGQAASTSAFGAQPTGGLFGTQATPAANTGFSFGGGSTGFGAPTTSAAPASGGLFGAPKPAASTFGGFAAAGQQQQQQPAPGGGLFGSAAGGFGQQVQIAPGSGTAAVQYQPTTVMEPPKEEGKPDPPNQTPHQFQSICCMPPYSNYSFEELRLQDYQANRKTPTASTSAPSFGGAFGQTTATPAFGAAPSQGGGLFGSTTPGFGAAQPATNAFGQSQPQQQGGGLFGTAGTSAFGQPAQQSGGLFGGATSQPAQTGGLFGSTSTAGTTGGLFGQPQQQQQQQQAQPSFGGFGQAAAKPANTGFSFGATSTAPASGGLFGQTQQQPQQAGGLFGQPQQQAGATGGLFGQPAQNAGATGGFNFGGSSSAAKPLFGSAPTASSAPAFGTSTAASAPKPAFSFGAAPAAGGSLFGAPAQQQQQQQPATNTFGATPSSGGGLFGGGANTFGQPAVTQQQQNTSSLFGSGSGSLFGAPKPAAPTTGGGLFGGGSSTTSSLFGASQPQQQQQFQQPQQQQPGSLFGSTMLGGSSGFGQSTAPQQAQQPTAYATADDVNAYGSNPLFQGSASRTGTPAVEEKKKPIFTSFRGTPVNRSATKITRLRGFGGSSLVSNSAGNGSPLSFGSSIGPNGSGSPSVGATPGSPAGGRSSPLRLVNGIGDDAALSPNAFVTRQSFKKLVIAPKHLNGGLATGSPAPAGFNGSVASKSGGARPKVSFDPAVETSSRERGQLAESISSAANESSFAGFEATPSKKNGTNSGSSLADDSFAAQVSTTPAGWPPRRSPASAASTPTKVGAYYTVPSLDALKKLPAASLRAVPDLVVGRVGYGRVAFKAPVDLTTLPSLDDLLGNIVVFEDRNCSVYPNDYDDDKPEVGQGLNVPATITLEKCWPLDKATRNPIKDPKHPKLSQHIKRLRGLEGTRYIDFSPEDGIWKFAVESF